MNSKEIIEKIKNIFSLYYGSKFYDLINKRFDDLEDIIFYKSNLNISADINPNILSLLGIDKYQKELINKEIPFSKYVVENNLPGMMPYLKDNNLRKIIYFPISLEKKYNYDCILIHEVLHVLYEHLIINNEDITVSRGGFETMTLKGENYENRNYEYLNEILHQEIAKDITKFAHENNLFIINNKEESLKSIDEYQKQKNLVIDSFYKNFKEDLIITNLTGDTEDFIEKIGRNNFETFNTWVIENYSSNSKMEDGFSIIENAKNNIKFL